MLIRHFILAFVLTGSFVLPLLPEAIANTYILPPRDQSMIGSILEITVDRNTTLSDEARRYNVGFNEIRLANPGIDPWLPQTGSTVLLPTQHILPDAPRKGLVLNVPEMRLYYYAGASGTSLPKVITHPVSIGRGEWETPLGNTRVTAKTRDPSWRPPESIRAEHAEAGEDLPRVVPPGPDNPLGKYALRLSLPGYLIHGTNKPYGIGMRVTHGCVRMYPEDIEALFDSVAVGTTVNIVNQPYKFGWHLDSLYLEAHPSDTGEGDAGIDLQALRDAIIGIDKKLGPELEVDRSDAMRIARQPNGIPRPVRVVERNLSGGR